MRRSSWPRKKSRRIDRVATSRWGALLAAAALIVAVDACRARDDASVPSEPLLTQAGNLAARFARAVLPAEKLYSSYVMADGERIPVASMPQASCAARRDGRLPAESVRWSVPFKTDVGDFIASTSVVSEDEATGLGEIAVEVDGMTSRVSGDTRSLRGMAEKLCRQMADKSEGDAPLAAAERDQMGTWLRAVAPDCEWTHGASGWSCQMATVTPGRAGEEIAAMRRSLMTRWRNPPYALVRRFALAVDMARVARDPDAKHTRSFCRLMDTALREELPLVARSTRWRQGLCESTVEDGGLTAARMASAGFVVTMRELTSLLDIGQRVSSSGLLSVEVDASKVDGSELHVRLLPDRNVMEHLVLEAVRSNSVAAGRVAARRAATTPVATGTWHPLLRESPTESMIAEALDLVAGQEVGRCAPPSAPDQTIADDCVAVGRYVALGVLSEIDFVVANGRSKALRLPPGKYEYGVQSVGTPGPTVAGKGAIDWSADRPRAEIKL